jgi:hypothetical protein
VDWESGAIARVASRNETRVLILRGVSDLVGEEYGRPEVFEEAAKTIMRHLFDVLPTWIEVSVPAETLSTVGNGRDQIGPPDIPRE